MKEGCSSHYSQGEILEVLIILEIQFECIVQEMEEDHWHPCYREDYHVKDMALVK